MKRRAFFAWLTGLAGGLVDGFHGRQWRITKYELTMRRITFEEESALLKAAYPRGTFDAMIEEESPFRARLRGKR